MNSTETIGILREARNVISDENRWIKGRATGPARNGIGLGYCSLGAVSTAIVNVGSTNLEAVGQAVGALTRAAPPGICIADFNDAESTTHADVLKMFDKAVCEVEREEKAA